MAARFVITDRAAPQTIKDELTGSTWLVYGGDELCALLNGLEADRQRLLDLLGGTNNEFVSFGENR